MASDQPIRHEPDSSVVRFYSIGIVAENKKRGSFNIIVTPAEQLTMLDGEITGNADTIEADGVMHSGSSYSSKVVASSTIEAQWLPFENTNRRTAPDVRRGEEVMIYQISDIQDIYYWTTFRDSFKLRRLETVRWLYQADPNNPPNEDGSNCYGFEFDTHEKIITIRTSQSNGENFKYTIQINAKDSSLVITDDVDNSFSINSPGSIVEMQNASGCSLRFEGPDATLTVPGNLTESVGSNHSTSVGGSTGVSTSGSTTIASGGSISITAGGGMSISSSGGGSMSSGGAMNIQAPSISLN